MKRSALPLPVGFPAGENRFCWSKKADPAAAEWTFRPRPSARRVRKFGPGRFAGESCRGPGGATGGSGGRRHAGDGRSRPSPYGLERKTRPAERRRSRRPEHRLDRELHHRREGRANLAVTGHPDGTEKSLANAHAPARVAFLCPPPCKVAAERAEATGSGFPWKSVTTEFTNPLRVRAGAGGLWTVQRRPACRQLRRRAAQDAVPPEWTSLDRLVETLDERIAGVRIYFSIYMRGAGVSGCGGGERRVLCEVGGHPYLGARVAAREVCLGCRGSFQPGTGGRDTVAPARRWRSPFRNVCCCTRRRTVPSTAVLLLFGRGPGLVPSRGSCRRGDTPRVLSLRLMESAESATLWLCGG
jgi:hypothetical protein